MFDPFIVRSGVAADVKYSIFEREKTDARIGEGSDIVHYVWKMSGLWIARGGAKPGGR